MMIFISLYDQCQCQFEQKRPSWGAEWGSLCYFPPILRQWTRMTTANAPSNIEFRSDFSFLTFWLTRENDS